MINDIRYKKAFFLAVSLHILLAFFLLAESTSKHAVLEASKENVPGQMMPVNTNSEPQPEIVRAESVDNQEIMKTVARLKEEKAQQQRAEQARQQALAKQAEQAKRARIAEQQRLVKLKEETERIAIARKKQIEEEQKRLKQLALQKEQEALRLEDLKKKQQDLLKQEAERIAQLKKKQELEQKEKEAKIQAEKTAKIVQEKAAAEKAAQQQAALEKAQQQAALAAAQQAKMAGEVDKYKALIVDAISRNWILPENTDRSLSCQFHIRLAPDGSVLEVSLVRSSGNPILDRSAQAAIYKASPLPVPSDPALFSQFRENNLTVRPTNVRG